jgi:hypothetical protein
MSDMKPRGERPSVPASLLERFYSDLDTMTPFRPSASLAAFVRESARRPPPG